MIDLDIVLAVVCAVDLQALIAVSGSVFAIVLQPAGLNVPGF